MIAPGKITPGRNAGPPPTATPGGGHSPAGGRGLPSVLRVTLAATLLLATACTAPTGVDVRHVASTRPAETGGRWHIFLFDPAEPRSLDTRIRLARAEIARTPGCTWGGASRAEIEAETLAQGGRRADTLLAAPVICR